VTVHEALEIAAAHHRDGRLKEAEDLDRRVLDQHPELPDALNLFGALLHQ